MASIQNKDQYKELTVSAIRHEAKDFITIEFNDEHNPILYQSGQYLALVKQWRGKEERRSYSITSSPALQEPLSIGVKRVANGLFSRFLSDELRPGDTLITTGAAGFFTLPYDLSQYKQVYLFAAGSGVTPIYSILKTILHLYPLLHVVLVYSNHAEESTAFLHSLEQYQTEYSGRLRTHFLFSTHKNIYRARLHQSLLNEILEQDKIEEREQTLAFVCGPKNYRRMCMYKLADAGLPDANIRKEVFEVNESISAVLPPDTTSHIAHLQMAGNVYHIQVDYPYSILKAAKANSIILPHSCEGGVCGSCSMHCKKGTVWMSYNEVLTQKDIDNGLVLTCTGHPVFGDVELHL